MSLIIIIKQGDLFPDVDTIVKDEVGAVVDVSNATVKFSMRNARDPSSIKVADQNGSVPDGPAGKIRYAWAGTDTDTPATYEGEFRVTPSGGADAFRVPTTGYITINVEPKVA